MNTGHHKAIIGIRFSQYTFLSMHHIDHFMGQKSTFSWGACAHTRTVISTLWLGTLSHFEARSGPDLNKPFWTKRCIEFPLIALVVQSFINEFWFSYV